MNGEIIISIFLMVGTIIVLIGIIELVRDWIGCVKEEDQKNDKKGR